ncbi:MAG TPA: hypothetical protein VKU85_12865 [bacterium]|nr:hypothetical protein [bacterium]
MLRTGLLLALLTSTLLLVGACTNWSGPGPKPEPGERVQWWIDRQPGGNMVYRARVRNDTQDPLRLTHIRLRYCHNVRKPLCDFDHLWGVEIAPGEIADFEVLPMNPNNNVSFRVHVAIEEQPEDKADTGEADTGAAAEES